VLPVLPRIEQEQCQSGRFIAILRGMTADAIGNRHDNRMIPAACATNRNYGKAAKKMGALSENKARGAEADETVLCTHESAINYFR